MIAGQADTVLILTRDVRPLLSGEPRTLRDVVLEHLMLIDAQKFNVRITDEDIDKYLKQLQKLNNCDLEQLEMLFKSRGYTLAEGRDQLRRRETIDQLQRFRIQDIHSSPVEQSHIEDYWKKHAPIEPASITLITAAVESNQNNADFEKELATQTLTKPIAWGAPFTVNIHDLAQDKQLFGQKVPGEIVLIEQIQGGFELTKIIAKNPERQAPLVTGNAEEDKKRMSEIENTIRQNRVKQALKDYENELLSQAASSIRFTYDRDRQEVYQELGTGEQNNKREQQPVN